MKLTAWADTPRSFRKAWMVMRLTSFFILILALHLSAKTTAQKITLSSNDLTLEQFFNQLQKQTGYSFILESGNVKQSVSVHVSNESLEAVLDIVLKPLNLTYRIRGKMVNIIHSNSDVGHGDSLSVAPPPIDVHGRVLDSLGNPLSGASVTVKGSKSGTTTDANGNFELKGVNENATLVITYTGFAKQQYKLHGQSTVNISLIPYVSELDKVQVIAYGTTSQRLSTGDVTTVYSKTIEQQPVNNPLLALEGRVPGLFITQSTGMAGSGVAVQIQGQNSIGYGNDPFYVVDGVPYQSSLLPSISGTLLGPGGYGSYGSPLSFINPSDIESISVLKDADATAIYGSRAANGAIIITTKKGKAGNTKVDINVQSGWGWVNHQVKMLTTPQYLQMRHEGILNDSIVNPSGYVAPDQYNSPDLMLWDTSRYTNWQKELIGGTSHYTNITAGISGGNTQTQFLISGTYHGETSVFPGDFSDKKGSVHFNLNNTSKDGKFKTQLLANYLVDNNQLPQADLTYSAMRLAPDAPPLYNPDGTLNWAPNSSGYFSWLYPGNPVAPLLNTYSNKTYNLLGNILLDYQILPGLNIKSSFGYNNLQSQETNIFPINANAPESRPFVKGSAQFGSNSINSWIIEPQLSFKKSVDRHNFEILLGTTFNQVDSKGSLIAATGYSSDLLLGDIKSASSISPISSVASTYKYNAFYGRINYNYNEEYLVDLSARRDGSSRFGQANQFHNFGAIGVAWIFSKEKAVQDYLRFLSFGKLRASYGTTGNDQIPNYQYMNLYASSLFVNMPYQGISGLYPQGLTNPYLQWEETKKLQFGLDLGFIKDRILISAIYFQNRSSNQLLSTQLPVITGFHNILTNLPATVQNTGWEISLSTTNIKTRDFSWTSNFNITVPVNKLIAFPGIENSIYNFFYFIGKPISIRNVFQSLGVNDTSGIYQFATAHGGSTYYPSVPADQTSTINLAPEYYGGLENTITYKSVSLSFLFQFVKQTGPNYEIGNYPGSFGGGNQPATVLNRWQKPGDHSSIQRFNADYTLINNYFNQTNSDAGFVDASFIRLKNVSLSWQMPESWIKGIKFQSGRIYIQGQNLLTITNYVGLDPEAKTFITLPPLAVLTIGAQISF